MKNRILKFVCVMAVFFASMMAFSESWYVCVGSFKEQNSAKHIMSEFQKVKIPAFISEYDSSRGKFYRVLLEGSYEKSSSAVIRCEEIKKLPVVKRLNIKDVWCCPLNENKTSGDVKIVEVVKEVIKEVPVEIEKEVIKEVPVEKIIEVIKEVPVEKIVEKEVIKEVVKEVPVEVEKEVIKEVIKEVPVEVEKEVIKEVIKEVPVEKIVEKEVIKEVIKEVPVPQVSEPEPEEAPEPEPETVEKEVAPEPEPAVPVEESEPAQETPAEPAKIREIFVKDSDSGNSIEAAEVKIGNYPSVLTDMNGSVTLPEGISDGVFDVTVSKDSEYAQASMKIEVLDGSIVTANQISLPKKVDYDRIKIILDWNKEPADLDLNVKAGWRNVSYRNQKSKNIQLDRDDRDGYGPETITIESPEKNVVYECYVIDYTDQDKSKIDGFGKSNAQVSIYLNNDFYKAFTIPEITNGYRWNVFKILNGNEILDINEIVKK